MGLAMLNKSQLRLSARFHSLRTIAVSGFAAVLVVGLGTVSMALFPAQRAGAAPTFNNTYYVNSASDNPGVTDCTSPVNIDCGIDNAITAFNTDTTPNDADEIVFASSIHTFSVTNPMQMLNGTSGLTLTIDGNGQSTTAVSGSGLHTVFDIGYVGSGSTSSSVDISGLTIKDAGAGGSPGYGAGIYNFGDNHTSLAVTNSTVTGNIANADGGGIYTGGPTTLTDDTISDNTAPSGGGGIVDTDVPVTITDSTISGNTGVGEGGIWNDGGTLTVTGSTISGNNANGGNVGGINSSGTLTVTDSTISGNKAPTATVAGGGYVGGIDNHGTATLTDDTIAGNTASEPDGAGIYNNSGDTLKVGATIVANNIGGDTTGSDCYGPISDLGYNLTDDTTCGLTRRRT